MVQSMWEDDAARRPSFTEVRKELVKVRDEIEDLTSRLPLDFELNGKNDKECKTVGENTRRVKVFPSR